MTTTSKKVGGPVNLLMLVGTIGAVIAETGRVAVKKGVKFIKTQKANRTALYEKESVFTITVDCNCENGLALSGGDQIKVLAVDGDAVLIEKIGDNNNPYFVSSELLCKISNYNE